jgi:hypothetical protein
MIILAANATEEAQARAAGVATVLRQPLPIDDAIDCVTLAAKVHVVERPNRSDARSGRAAQIAVWCRRPTVVCHGTTYCKD